MLPPARDTICGTRARRLGPSVLVACAAGFLAAGCSQDGPGEAIEVAASIPDQPAVDERPLGSSAARRLYATHCAACHGADGRGDGPAAERLHPSPRDFRSSPMRFAGDGSPGGRLAAIEKEIRQGVPRSGMPGYASVLTDQQIRALARYVDELGQGPAGSGPATRGPGEPPPFNQWLVMDGARLYRATACHSCHGETGRGDADGSELLRDSLGRPVRPGDLASGLFKAGGRPEDIYRAILEGVPGTPMLGYADTLLRERRDGTIDDRDAWALVAYIKSLAPSPRLEGVPSGARLRVQALPDEGMLFDPSRPQWLEVERTKIALRPLWQRVEQTVSMDVAFVRAGGWIGVQLSWADPTPDVDRRESVFPDQTAVMFALGDEVPAMPMGLGVEGASVSAPVNVWQWKANRQFDASFGGSAGSPRELPEGIYHLFVLDREGGPAAVEPGPAWDGLGADLMPGEALYAAGLAAGNIPSDPSLVRHGALEANAEGFGTLKYQSAEDQDVLSSAVWGNGRWFVTMFRRVDTGQEHDIHLRPGRRVPVAFAVWDGSRGDRDGVKLISGWHWAELGD
jgi:mono/diheme cytochrome c family protein